MLRNGALRAGQGSGASDPGKKPPHCGRAGARLASDRVRAKDTSPAPWAAATLRIPRGKGGCAMGMAGGARCDPAREISPTRIRDPAKGLS